MYNERGGLGLMVEVSTVRGEELVRWWQSEQ